MVKPMKIAVQVNIEEGDVIVTDAQAFELKRRIVTHTMEWGADMALMRLGWTPPPEYFERPDDTPNFNIKEEDGQFKIYANEKLIAVTEHRWVSRALASNQAMYRRLQELIHANREPD